MGSIARREGHFGIYCHSPHQVVDWGEAISLGKHTSTLRNGKVGCGGGGKVGV